MSAQPTTWEEVEAVRRSVGHDDAVQESLFLQKQFRRQWSNRMAASPVDLNDVVRTLSGKKIPFVLIGAHAYGGWTGRPRSTFDVDVLVKSGRNHTRAVSALKTLYPSLEVRSFPGLTAFFIPGERDSVLDVIYPHRADLEDTLENAVWITNEEHGLRYRIPTLEAALASKYGAMLNPDRELLKRGQDAIDFGFMVKHSQDEDQRPIDMDRLKLLGEMVWPGGGGAEIVRLVEEVNSAGLIDTVKLFRGPGL
jgi:hypothetical protein